MLGLFDHLNRSFVANLEVQVLGQRQFGQADGTLVLLIRRAGEVNLLAHPERSVLGPTVGPIVADAEVDKGPSLLVAGLPAGLEGYRATVDGPVGSVGCDIEAAAWTFVSII